MNNNDTLLTEQAIGDVAEIAGIAPGNTYELTYDIDILTGTAGDDTFIETLTSSVDAGDQIIGGEGTDTFLIRISSGPSYTNLTRASVFQGIERIVLETEFGNEHTVVLNETIASELNYIDLSKAARSVLELEQGTYDFRGKQLIGFDSIELKNCSVTFDDKAAALACRFAGDWSGIGGSVTLASGENFTPEERKLLFSHHIISITDSSGTYTNAVPAIGNLDGESASVVKGQSVLLDQSGDATIWDDGPLGRLEVYSVYNWIDEDRLGIATGAEVQVNGTIVTVAGVDIGTIVQDGTTSAGLVIEFNANATPALVQTLVRSLNYTNLDPVHPDRTLREFVVELYDENGVSSSSSVSIKITSPDTDPVLTVTPNVYDITDTQSVSPFADAVVSDPDGSTLTLFVVMDDPSKGIFSGYSDGVYDSRNGFYYLTGTAAEVQDALRHLIFTPRDRDGSPGSIETTTFKVIISDENFTVSDTSVSVNALDPQSTPTVVGLSDNAIREYPFDDTFIGELSADVEGEYVYKLVLSDGTLADSDGTFKIVGNQLQNDTRVGLDYEQRSDYQVTVRLMKAGETGPDAWHLDSTFTIVVTDVFGENVIGTSADELILANIGNDTLKGGDGNDTLGGGVGRDNLTGGAGHDYFRFDTKPSVSNRDVITDFTVGEDKIQIDASVFGLGALSGAMTAARFVVGSEATTTTQRFIYEKTATSAKLYYDADGSGTAFQKVELVSFTTIKPDLSLSDFDVIA